MGFREKLHDPDSIWYCRGPPGDPLWWGYLDDGRGWTARPKSQYMQSPDYNSKLREQMKIERKQQQGLQGLAPPAFAGVPGNNMNNMNGIPPQYGGGMPPPQYGYSPNPNYNGYGNNYNPSLPPPAYVGGLPAYPNAGPTGTTNGFPADKKNEKKPHSGGKIMRAIGKVLGENMGEQAANQQTDAAMNDGSGSGGGGGLFSSLFGGGDGGGSSGNGGGSGDGGGGGGDGGGAC